jgi:hypothetical protein
MKRRALVFWSLLLIFGAASLYWLVQTPRVPGQLHRAIPASATFLSFHQDLNGRWDAVVAHPLLLGLMESLGTERSEVERISRDPGFRRLLKLLGSDDLLLAYVPRMRSNGEAAWVFSSWLGGHSQRVRWMLNSSRLPEIKRAATRNGWQVWVWAPRELKGQRITFALAEGLVVGCVAAETVGIDDALACLDGHAGSVADRPGLYLAEAGQASDRGWFRNARGELFPFTLALTPQGGVQAAVQTPWPLPPAVSASTGTVIQLDGWSELVGSHAVAAAAFDRSLVRDWLRATFTNAIGQEVAGLLAGDTEGTVGLALLGGEYSGRFMAVRLPTLVAGVAGSPVAQTKYVLGALDRLNVLMRWGLVAAPTLIGSTPVYAIEATAGGIYAQLAREEHIAYTPTASGLVFASNLATVERLIRERSGTNVVARPWQQGLEQLAHGQARGFLWFDAAEGAKVVRLGVTAWSLKLLLEDPQGTQETRQRMNDFKAWMDTLSPLGQITIGWAERDGRVALTLHAGEL